ncbi:MAG: hypothetical protein P8H32_05965 [Oceanicoccus sp.]|uniref:hypothetical protein n=1 Tax=Oceanicoccus sp. TaxID=2691044 RepID=UPI00261C7564|nr:hypothetical protein [Oceanicoccus sp.]MDG1772964.1 hypothetical protein [Oceanicoccus sp.]
MWKMMQKVADKLTRAGLVLSMAMVLLFPQLGYTQAVEEEPSALAMAGDLVIARPLLLVATVVGTAFYVVSLPFSLAGGNAIEAGETLVVGPAKSTFVRCLGCTRSGYKKDVVAYED